MPDMLIKLFNLKKMEAVFSGGSGIDVRKPIGCEVTRIVRWVASTFNERWASEAQVALSILPFGCYIALNNGEIVGFCCFDATALGFIGPVGVESRFRKMGIGKRLLLSCCHEMRMRGYGYAVVGRVEKENYDFYRKVVGAVEISESEPGIYARMLN